VLVALNQARSSLGRRRSLANFFSTCPISVKWHSYVIETEAPPHVKPLFLYETLFFCTHNCPQNSAGTFGQLT
jgi:hypothetical protein